MQNIIREPISAAKDSYPILGDEVINMDDEETGYAAKCNEYLDQDLN